MIETNCFCIGRANGRTGRSDPKRQQNQQLSRRDDSQTTDLGVRAWDLVVPRMGLIGGEMPSAWPDISGRFCALHISISPNRRGPRRFRGARLCEPLHVDSNRRAGFVKTLGGRQRSCGSQTRAPLVAALPRCVCSLPRPIRNPKPQLDGLRRDNLLNPSDKIP